MEDTESELLARFDSLFLSGQNLRNMIVYMCNNCTSDVQDPITHTVCMFLSAPINVSITKTGVAPFQGHNTAIFPFFCMTQEQQALILDLLHFMQEEGRATLSTQMGGGGMAVLNARGARRYAETREVLYQFFQSCKGIEGMQEAVRDNICNIIVQRVCSTVHIPRRTLNEVMERVQEGCGGKKDCPMASGGPPVECHP